MTGGVSRFIRASACPSGLLTAAGMVASAATVLGFLGRFSWRLDLLSHFRVQYLLALGILGLLLLVTPRRKTAIAFLVFACVNLGVVLPLYFGDTQAAPEAADGLRAMLLNVNTQSGDPERVRQLIQEADPDILVLEEISPQWMYDLRFLSTSHPHSCVRPRGDNFGIGLFSKLPLSRGEIVTIGDVGLPSIVATVDTGGAPLRVIATHPPPPAGKTCSDWRNDQLHELANPLRAPGPLMLLGDLNVTPWNHHFQKLLKRTGLIDSARGHGVQPTWPVQNPLLWIPIDHCLHSEEIRVGNREVRGNVGSDHYALIVDFVIVAAGTSPASTTPAPESGLR